MRNKRTKSKYTHRNILKIIRYNQKQLEDYNINIIAIETSKEAVSKLLGGSFLNSIGSIMSDEYSFFYDIINAEPEFFKLSRMKHNH